ncbi:ADP-ribosylarginine hydrolase Tri1-like [Ylistrum balloti]|uniref:ADP-ribosylarginine hydrolase Tri1-like n=1 Tax=Ylistrum balloti TaxID=509963 RepID=UPI002905ACFC|nr:ADP-ribosylarginine hydrolase Tri1-like [Ylistrum balloti]
MATSNTQTDSQQESPTVPDLKIENQPTDDGSTLHVDCAAITLEDSSKSLPVDGAQTLSAVGTKPLPVDGAKISSGVGSTCTASPVDGATASPVDGSDVLTIEGALASATVVTTALQEDDAKMSQTFGKKTLDINNDTVQRILGTIFGQCAGDALGLLTEFLTKKECEMYYKSVKENLEYSHKEIVCDMHRIRWKVGDWTDDSDQMILILQSLIDTQGKVDVNDFARKIKNWIKSGFPELGDFAGMGQGKTTMTVIKNPDYVNDPHAAADLVWTANGKVLAPNGSVMRTSILGVHMYSDLDTVVQNAITIGKATHADPRCQASVVAVCVAIALMLQRQPKHLDKKGNYNIKAIINDCYDYASKCLETEKEKKELKTYLKCTKLKELKLDEEGKIGYTYKSMGTAFWALKQENIRETITKIVMEGGDADSNACVAGALMGCKYGAGAIPSSWTQNLVHKEWLEAIIDRYFCMMAEVHNIDFTPYWTGHLS